MFEKEIKISGPGGCLHNVYDIIKQALESNGYLTNTIEVGYSKSPNGFLERHETCNKTIHNGDGDLIKLIVDAVPWGG